MDGEILKLKENMVKSGGDGGVMSGSGGRVYGLGEKVSEGKDIYKSVNGCCKEVYLVRLSG